MAQRTEKSRCCSGHLTLAPGTLRRSSCSVTRTKTAALPLFGPAAPCPAGEPGVSDQLGGSVYRTTSSDGGRVGTRVGVRHPSVVRSLPGTRTSLAHLRERASTAGPAGGCGGVRRRRAAEATVPGPPGASSVLLSVAVGDVDPCGALTAVIGSTDGWASPVVPQLNASTVAGAAGPWRCHAVWPEPDR